jgi:hypothetical protein
MTGQAGTAWRELQSLGCGVHELTIHEADIQIQAILNPQRPRMPGK